MITRQNIIILCVVRSNHKWNVKIVVNVTDRDNSIIYLTQTRFIFLIWRKIMSTEEIRKYLQDLDLCAICLLRYKNVSFQEYSSVIKELESEAAKDVENDADEENTTKRQRTETCIACLGLFQSINSVAKKLIDTSNLQEYECNSLYTSIQTPIALMVRELSLWMALIEKFPGKIDESKISVVLLFSLLSLTYYDSFRRFTTKYFD